MRSLIDVAIIYIATGRGQADDCISGFMSLDRMNKVLDIVNAPYDQQAIIPEINFTCNGTIRTWIILGQWRNNGENNIELQIWRSSGSGSYNRVQSTVVTVATSNDIALGVYHLPTNLSFQAGDILGFYLPSDSRFRLRLAMHMEPLQTVYLRNGNPDTEFDTTASSSSRMQNVLVSVETGKFLVDVIINLNHTFSSMCIDPPDCGSGFMSVETIVELGEVGRFTGRNRRQQITPTITFTCNGWITKWIIGALWDGGNVLFPELQIWRNDGNDTYRKINGTFISVETNNASLIYKYSNFSPIPFQAGDILGAFVPQGGLSKLKLRSEGNRGHLNYYIRTDVSAIESPYDSINLSGIVTRATYHPMVSVEISKSIECHIHRCSRWSSRSSDSIFVSTTPPHFVRQSHKLNMHVPFTKAKANNGRADLSYWCIVLRVCNHGMIC